MTELEEFRKEVSRIKQSQPGTKYPAVLRAFALRYAEKRQAAGVAQSQVVQELGISEPTLLKWRRDVPPQVLRQVALASAPSPQAAPEPEARPTQGGSAQPGVPAEEPERQSAAVSPPGGGTVALVSPRGYRLEGLLLEQGLWLMRELG